jgi:hypothetical protein
LKPPVQTSIAPRFRIHRYPNKTTPISQKFIVQKASSSPAFFKSEKLLVKVTLTIKKNENAIFLNEQKNLDSTTATSLHTNIQKKK